MCDIKQKSNTTKDEYLKEFQKHYDKRHNEENKLYQYLCNGFPTENNVIFFDDSLEHISAVHENCRKTTAVYLPFDRPFLFKNMKGNDNEKYSNSIRSDNSYVQKSKSKMTVTSSGITNEMVYLSDNKKLPSYVQRLYDWVFQTPHLKNRIVIFDWDFTLNVSNGFYLYDETGYSKKDYEKLLTDTLLYLFGGEHRYKIIKDMMKYLIHNNVKIYIVTCNGNAAEPHGKMKFTRLMQHLLDGEYFQSKHLLYVNHEVEFKDKAINRIIRIENKKPFSLRKTRIKKVKNNRKIRLISPNVLQTLKKKVLF